MNNKPVYVTFCNEKIESEYESLKIGKFEDKELYKFISRAMDDLKQNPGCGIKISKKLWPRDYIQNYNIINLWKYDLPKAWRLFYTIKEDKVMILGIILEWMTHKDYERKFNY